MPTPAIEVRTLSHAFGPREVLHQVTFEVQGGEIFGLLGPNGAGKTTTIRLLNGLYTPKSGEITVLGLDPAREGGQVRRISGVLTETPALYERMNARENLEFHGGLCGLHGSALQQRIAELLHFFELSERASELTGKYSKGMKQRLALARAVLARPRVLYLDEPTSSLDPESALQVRELIDELARREGSAVLLCTHRLEDAQRLCDRVAILREGKVLAQGSLEELKALYNPGTVVTVGFAAPPARDVLEGLGGETPPSAEEVLDWTFCLPDGEAIPMLVANLVRRGAQILSVVPQQANLEDIYFRLQNAAEGENQ